MWRLQAFVKKGVALSRFYAFLWPRWRCVFTLLTVLSVMLAVLPTPAHAGDNVWTPIGPEGGTIHVLAVDPTNPTTIYAGTGYGIYKSINGGGSWMFSSNGLVENLTTYDKAIYDIKIDPTTPSTLYAATVNGIFTSIDAGTHWNATTMINDSKTLVIDPRNPSTLYAGRGFGVSKSVDSGATWADISTGLNSNTVIALAVDPQTPAIVYAGTINGIFKSTDGGNNWSALSISGIPINQSVNAIAVNPITPTTLYIATADSIFKSTDSGASWSKVLNSESIILVIDPTNPAIIYAGTYSGIFKSSNNGTTWGAANTGLITSNAVNALAIDPITPTNVYAGIDNDGIYKSTNSGTTWSAINTELVNTYMKLHIDPQTPTVMYGVMAASLIYKTTDRGAHWSVMPSAMVYNNGRQASRINTLAISPQTPTTLYAGTDAGPFKSVDGGQSWTWLYACSIFCFLPSVSALAVDPVAPETVYMGTVKTWFTSGGVAKSINGDSYWNGAKSTGLPNATVHTLAIDPQHPMTLYAGTDVGLFKSSNGADKWDSINTGLPISVSVYTLAINPVSTNILYANTAQGLFKSTNGGASWAEVKIGADGNGINAVVINPQNPDLLYVGHYTGVYQSSDGGASWGVFNPGLTNTEITDMTIDPKTPTILYAGTNGSGVYTLRIVPVPIIPVQPASQSISAGQSATLQVTATDNTSLTYQWYEGNSGDITKPISSATSNTYTTPPLTNTAHFWVRVTNALGGHTDSQTATITVGATLPELDLLANQTIVSGQSATISVTTHGNGTFNYQWYEGNPGDISKPINGATANTFTTGVLTSNHNFWVRVTNTQGAGVDSTTAAITVVTHLGINAPASTTTGAAFTIMVTARNSNDAVAPGYRGTIQITSSDNQANLPPDYTFNDSDKGVHSFSLTFKTPNGQTLKVSDTTNNTVQSNATITVKPQTPPPSTQFLYLPLITHG